MLKEVLYATNNPGKIDEVSKLLKYDGIQVVSPKDLNINLEVPEIGDSLKENALLKAKAFSKVSNGRLVLADDTGLEIDSLNREPGIYIRRWKDHKTKMTDDEIIDYCLDLMKNIPLKERGAQFRTVIVLAQLDGTVDMAEGILRGIIQEKVNSIRVEGFPFESLFYVSNWKMILGKQHQLAVSEKKEKLNHREIALKKMIPIIKTLLQK